MSFKYSEGRIVFGDENSVRESFKRFHDQEIDVTRLCEGDDGYSGRRTTIGGECSVTGPGTFQGKNYSTLIFKPSDEPGWWIDRSDLHEQLKTAVSVRNVWTSVIPSCAAAIRTTIFVWSSISWRCVSAWA